MGNRREDDRVDMVHDVRLFEEKFDIPRKVSPGWLKPVDQNFRQNFIREEIRELEKAYDAYSHGQGDSGVLADYLDALLDVTYVVIGTANQMGLDFKEGWRRVQIANMAKERATSGQDPRSKRGHKLDIVKPEGWRAPEFHDLVDPTSTTCFACGNTHQNAWSAEEMVKEAKKNGLNIESEAVVIICDDCYSQVELPFEGDPS